MAIDMEKFKPFPPGPPRTKFAQYIDQAALEAYYSLWAAMEAMDVAALSSCISTFAQTIDAAVDEGRYKALAFTAAEKCWLLGQAHLARMGELELQAPTKTDVHTAFMESYLWARTAVQGQERKRALDLPAPAGPRW